MNWTEYFKNCKEVLDAGFKPPILGNDKDSAKKRQELARFINNNMKGIKNEEKSVQ
jgi:hypothetical protein